MLSSKSNSKRPLYISATKYWREIQTRAKRKEREATISNLHNVPILTKIQLDLTINSKIH